MKNIAEPVILQTFIPKAFVKTLNEPVLSWLASLDKSQFYAMLKSPLIERAAGKFRLGSVLIVAG
jgi:hypothetical protein